MQATVIFVISLLLSLQELAGSTAHLPHLSLELAEDLKGQVCFRTASNVQTALHDPLSYDNIKSYPKKPSTGMKC